MEMIKLDAKNLTEEQFEQMVQIELNCGLDPYTPEMLRECIAYMDTYGCMDGDRVAGFVTVHPSARYLGGGVYIVNLNVAKPYRRQGLGKQLMLTACAQYGGSHRGRLVTLDVSKSNTAALELYLGLGFQITDLPSGNGETDYVMSASLDKILGTRKTKRLVLRPIPMTDDGCLGDIFLDDTVKKTYMVPDLSCDEAQRLGRKIAMLSCSPARYVRGIYLDGSLIGLINDVGIDNGCIELGWVIAPKHQGNGYATEAICAAIDDLFEKGYTQIIAGAFAENTASIRVMEKSGMVLQEKAEEIVYRGQTHTCVYFAKAKCNYQAN